MMAAYVLGGAALLLLVGFAQTLLKIRDVLERRRFTNDYIERLKELLERVHSCGFDEEANKTHDWPPAEAIREGRLKEAMYAARAFVAGG